jgi:hypothetical protein
MRLPNLLAMDTKTRGQSPSFFNSCPAPFGDVLGPILCELSALARNPLVAFPRRAGDPWVSRKDAKTDGEMRDSPRGFFIGSTLDCPEFLANLF